MERGVSMRQIIKEYKTVSEVSLHSRDQVLSECLREGWSLWGDPYTYTDADKVTHYAQAVVMVLTIEDGPGEAFTL